VSGNAVNPDLLFSGGGKPEMVLACPDNVSNNTKSARVEKGGKKVAGCDVNASNPENVTNEPGMRCLPNLISPAMSNDKSNVSDPPA